MRERNTKIKTAQIQTAQAESQEVSSVPADVHQVILNKINRSSKINKKRTHNYNKNKLQQKHRLGMASNK